MSWLKSSSEKHGEKFHSVALAHGQEALFGPLVKEDTEWLTPGGFATETQTFYATLPSGYQLMFQVIHSSVGLWYPNIQFTFRYANPTTGDHSWKSTSVTNFTPGASNPKLDKRSVRSDQFTITVDPANPTVMVVQGKYDDEASLSVTVKQLAEGFKVGAGPKGGFSYFGSLTGKPTHGDAPAIDGGKDGYCIHRFWPRTEISGTLRLGKETIDLAGSRGVFIHAIQGLRPNLLASRWNFANFQSLGEDGVSLIMMEYTTPHGYGSQVVNVGGVVVGDKLIAVTAGGSGFVGGSSCLQEDKQLDKETSYDAPGKITYEWEGKTIGAEGKSKAIIRQNIATSKPGEPYETKGLIIKVDVLGEIPYIIRKFVNYAAGTKPYIYTWMNEETASITIPDAEAEGGVKTLEVKGVLFNEATFISKD